MGRGREIASVNLTLHLKYQKLSFVNTDPAVAQTPRYVVVNVKSRKLNSRR